MSAAGVLNAALLQSLRASDDVGGRINGVFAGAAVQASRPYAEIAPAIAIDWSAKDWTGRELSAGVTIRDAGDTPERLHALIGAAEAAIEALPRALDGWQIASLVFLRSRMLREAPGLWAATVEYRVRMMEVL